MPETEPDWDTVMEMEAESRRDAGIESPAATMRRAAQLMRERAADAEKEGYGSTHPGKPWCPEWTYTVVRHVERNLDTECTAHPWGSENEGDCNTWGRYAGYHVAGMHPGVALALAAWLDAAWNEGMEWDEALSVARAYLGEPDDRRT